MSSSPVASSDSHDIESDTMDRHRSLDKDHHINPPILLITQADVISTGNMGEYLEHCSHMTDY